ncbi:MAG: 50S ribosomal protein L6 [Actinomycetia bacterium]|nr:50S ribosomal protein L6 [Actinomycetes bacterium]MCP4963211.1 50S ribosomal protein L6 [Actinomycetes bacterium]
MSRIGKAPITVPNGTDVSVDGRTVAVKGSKGELTQEIPESISVSVDDGMINVSRTDDERDTRSLHGLTRALVANMVKGVNEGFTKELAIVGVGYRAQSKGPSQLELALGFSHPVFVDAPEGVTFEVATPTSIKVLGIDKQLVGQVAADIRKHRPPEPYKGKGIRYVDEYVLRKAGKAAK